MSMLWTPTVTYERVQYKDEAEFENAVDEVAPLLFGPNRIYLNTKKKLTIASGLSNIPDVTC